MQIYEAGIGQLTLPANCRLTMFAAVADLVGHAPGISHLQSGRSRLRTPGERPLALLAYHLAYVSFPERRMNACDQKDICHNRDLLG
jgi:hypothetical protein